ncbi:MAG TPA: amidohydrolase family protein [Candidatus Acidoferrales bacterium]|nr:amidohydrolase family protein [Candidatus Acidoferrales bacterium]
MPFRLGRILSFALIALVALLATRRGAPLAPVQADEPPFFVIEHARIVPVSGPPIDDGTVVIARGLIQAVGSGAKAPPGAEIIDGHGMVVYPGLVDAMSTVGLVAGPPPGGGPEPAAPAPPAPARAAPPARPAVSQGPEDRPGTQPWRIAADHLEPTDPRIRRWRDAGFTTVLACPAGGMLPGQGSIVDLADGRPIDMVVKTYAAVPISLTPSGNFFSFPGSLMGAIAYVRQVYIDARWYQQAAAVYNADARGLERPHFDRTERVMAQTLERHTPVLLPGNLDKEILRAIDIAGELDVPAVLYGLQQGYAVAGQTAASRLPALVDLDWPARPKDSDPQAPVTLDVLRFRDRAPSTPAALARAGVPFGFYSGGITDPKDTLKNAKKAIDAGLDPAAALRAFTLGAAQILGVADRLGSIEPGKIANLVVADGDLFNPATKLKLVFVDGRRYTIHETPATPRPPAAAPAN